jgi:hypothetical protein
VIKAGKKNACGGDAGEQKVKLTYFDTKTKVQSEAKNNIIIYL